MASPSDNERARLYRLAGTGMEFLGAILVCVLAGHFLDKWLGTAPVLLLIGVGLGFAVGLFQLVRLSKSNSPSRPK